MLSPQPLQRVLLILILIGVVIGVATAIDLKAICNTTSYPDSCYRGLAPIVESQNDNVGLHEVYKLSVGIAIDEVLRASNGLFKLEQKFKNVSDPMSLSALKFCRDLLYTRAFTSLNDGLATPNDKPTAETFEDHKTWLTTAGGYHQTCIDAFDGAKDAVLKRAVLEQLQSSIELTSNSLAILCTFQKSLGKSQRSLMGSGHMLWWFSKRERKLLERPLKDIHIDVVVAKDGSGNFNTIGDALNAAPNSSSTRFVIHVKAGTYNENVKVDVTKSNIFMIGDGMDATIVSGSLCSGGGVQTYDTSTFKVSGAGFMARDMGFENTAGVASGQAVALMVDADKSAFFRCKITSYQDTLLAQGNRQFFSTCQIYGTVDFIFGYSAAVFENTKILPRKPLTGQANVITAQGKFEGGANSGFSFINCTVTPAQNLGGAATFLGRPWKNYSTVVFMHTYMGSLVDPTGWLPWDRYMPETVYYGEYWNTGVGAVTGKRIKGMGVHRKMKRSEANRFSVDAFIDGGKWLPSMGVSYSR